MFSNEIDSYLNEKSFELNKSELMQLLKSSPQLSRFESKSSLIFPNRYVLGTDENVNWEVEIVGD